MKICAACCVELPKEKFSNKQWKLKQYERRCKVCTNVDRDVQLKPPPKDKGPSCWICLDEGTDELGQPIRRDCSCRGSDAGFAHLSCLTSYAEQKSDDNLQNNISPKEPFQICPHCRKNYLNDIAIDLANNYVSFVEAGYSDYPDVCIWAQTLRLESLTAYNRNRTDSQTEEAREVSQRILCMIREMEAEGLPLSRQLCITEAYAHEIQGCMIKEEDNTERIPQALMHLERSKAVLQKHGESIGIARIEALIIEATAEISEDYDVEGLIKCTEEKYNETIKERGPSALDTIQVGLDLARTLKNHHYGWRAEGLFGELHKLSQLNHGDGHYLTKNAHEAMYRCLARMVSLPSDNGGQAIGFKEYHDEDKDVIFYQLWNYDNNFETCAIEGPFGRDREMSRSTLRLATTDIIYTLGTPVFFIPGDGEEHRHLFRKLGDIRSYDPETKCYTVHWKDDSLEPCAVHHCNLVVSNGISSDGGRSLN